MTLARLIGLCLFVLVGYHYLNQPLGLNLAASLGLLLFALALTHVYRGYRPDRQNGFGWGVMVLSCMLLAAFPHLNWFMLLPFITFWIGFRLAGLSVGGWVSDGDGGVGSDGFFGDGGDGGCDGGGD